MNSRVEKGKRWFKWVMMLVLITSAVKVLFAFGYAPKNSPFYGVQAEAKAAKRGLWANNDPVPPWEWRSRSKREKDEQNQAR